MQDTNKLEQQLLKTAWVEESKEVIEFVPEEDLTKTQVTVLNKCINKQDLTPNQLNELKKVLQKYRPAIQKIRPSETIEKYEDVVQMMSTEEEFIRLMQSDEQKNILVHLPLPNGRKVGFNFEVLPLNDSRVVEALELNIDLFRDYSVEEINTYNRFAQGEEITEEEASIISKMNQDILNKQSSKKITAINNFLAYQLKIIGSNSTLKERKQFWELFPFNAKTSVFLRVQNMLGMNEQDNRDLFPVS